MKQRVLLAAALMVGAGPAPWAMQDPPAPVVLGPAREMSPAEAASRLTGRWKLNEELSPLPRAGSSPAAGSVPSRGSGFRGGPAGSNGGGGANGMRRPQQTLEQLRQLQVRAIYRELTTRPLDLTMTATLTGATLVDEEGSERVLTINNKKGKLDLGTAIVDAKAYWNGPALTLELETDNDLKLFEIFELSPTGRQMLVTLRTAENAAAARAQVSGNLHRVYDRIERQ
jgi:hypothetical protein